MSGPGQLQVEFYFDFACPWSFLACVRLREAAMRTEAAIVWKPFNRQRVADALGIDAEPVIDSRLRRANYQRLDLRAWADYCGLQIRWPEDPVYACPRALRGALAAIGAGRAAPYSLAVFAAHHARGEDIDDPAVLVRLADAADVPAQAFVELVQDELADAAIDAHADELIARGGFGSPTMFVEDQPYFGNERMPLVEFALGQASGRRFVMPGAHG